MTTRPDLRKHVAICVSCHHWQIDIRPGAISDLGGWVAAVRAIGEIHSEHTFNECPNAGGRVKVLGKWVEPPKMSDGKPATGTIGFLPLPRWWVA